MVIIRDSKYTPPTPIPNTIIIEPYATGRHANYVKQAKEKAYPNALMEAMDAPTLQGVKDKTNIHRINSIRDIIEKALNEHGKVVINMSFGINIPYSEFNKLLEYIGSFNPQYSSNHSFLYRKFKTLIGHNTQTTPSKPLIAACREYTSNPQYKLTTEDKNELRKFIFSEQNLLNAQTPIVNPLNYDIFKQLESIFINPTTNKPYKELTVNTSLSNANIAPKENNGMVTLYSLLPGARSIGCQFAKILTNPQFENFTANPFFLTSNIHTSIKSLATELSNSSVKDLHNTQGIESTKWYDDERIKGENRYKISKKLFNLANVTNTDHLKYREIQYIKSQVGENQIKNLYEILVTDPAILEKFNLTEPQQFMAVANKNGKLKELYHYVKGNSFGTPRIHDQPLNKDPQKSSLIWTM